MANHINILTDSTIGKIAAGEVVEKPASAVKELIENSIDAGADSIEIEVESAGQSLIRVADNGAGMLPKDAEISCQRHTTSKLKDISDLETIRTLGFRGEALSSISAVSKVDITTFNEEKSSGTHIYLESGEILKIRPAGRSKGTTVAVRDLFYNVPARRKFLKKEASELSEIVNTVGRLAISNPGIEFKLEQEKRSLLYAAKDMDTLARISLILGKDVSDHMVKIGSLSEKYKITGFVSRPSNTRRDRRNQIFFINGRYFQSKLLSDALYGAYRSMLERGRFPSAVLFIETDPGEIDVNVHPSKLLVKFKDERSLKNDVINAVKTSFDIVKQQVADRGHAESGEKIVSGPGDLAHCDDNVSQTEFSYTLKESFLRPVSSDRGMGLFEKGDIFQIGGCYIARIKGDRINVTDQHAAHERVLYEVFTNAAQKGAPEVQQLLFPERIDLSASEAVVVEKVMKDLGSLGFQVEAFGEKSFVVQAVPAIIKDRDVKTVVQDMISDIAELNLSKTEYVDQIIKIASCRGALKAGDRLGREEMWALLEQLERCSLPFTCPHGRPTQFDITLDEMEKRFRRK